MDLYTHGLSDAAKRRPIDGNAGMFIQNGSIACPRQSDAVLLAVLLAKNDPE